MIMNQNRNRILIFFCSGPWTPQGVRPGESKGQCEGKKPGPGRRIGQRYFYLDTRSGRHRHSHGYVGMVLVNINGKNLFTECSESLKIPTFTYSSKITLMRLLARIKQPTAIMTRETQLSRNISLALALLGGSVFTRKKFYLEE